MIGGNSMIAEQICKNCHNPLCLHKVPIFASLEFDDMKKVHQYITHKNYQKGEFIFREGETLDSIIIINQGSAKAVKYSSEGREQILHVFMEGDFFGEKHLLNNDIADYSVEVLKPVGTCMLRKDTFEKLLHQHPEIAVKIIVELGKRLSQLESTIRSIGVRSVDTRISELLLEYGKLYGERVKEGVMIHLPLSREGMANYLGIARETLSRKLTALEIDGFIQSIGNKKILLIKEKELIEISQLG